MQIDVGLLYFYNRPCRPIFGCMQIWLVDPSPVFHIEKHAGRIQNSQILPIQHHNHSAPSQPVFYLRRDCLLTYFLHAVCGNPAVFRVLNLMHHTGADLEVVGGVRNSGGGASRPVQGQ